jgi:hypothetical protein
MIASAAKAGFLSELYRSAKATAPPQSTIFDEEIHFGIVEILV